MFTGERHFLTQDAFTRPLPEVLILLLFTMSLWGLAAQDGDAREQSCRDSVGEGKRNPEKKRATLDCTPAVRDLPDLVLEDQKFLWASPFRLKRRDLPWAAAVVVTTADLFSFDRSVGQEFSENPPGSGYRFSRQVGLYGSPVTAAGIAGSIYLFGHLKNSKHARATGLRGLEAVADSQIVVEILKLATQRPRPTFSGGRVRDHNADGRFFAGGNSFPSGHAAGAWALASVLSAEYSDRRWVAPAAYTFATLVSTARLIERRHFPSDVFVGGVFGYLIGRHASRPCRESAFVPCGLELAPSSPPGGGAAFTITWKF